MSRRGWQWVCALSLSVAVAWMVLPTFPMSWVVEPVPFGRVVNWHSWLDPVVLGNAVFYAPVTALAATVSAVVAWVGLVVRRPRPATMWWAIAAAAALLLGASLTASVGWSHAVALGLLLAGAVAAWYAHRLSQVPPARIPAVTASPTE